MNATNSPTDNYVLSYDDASGGFTWVSGGGGGEANQNAFSTVAVSGQSDVAADSTTDTLNLAAGSNVTITTTAGTDTVTIAATDTNTMGSGFTVSATTDSNATTITQGDDLFLRRVLELLAKLQQMAQSQFHVQSLTLIHNLVQSKFKIS